MPRLILPCAAFVAVAAWVSQATLAMASPGGPRIALLPVSASALLLAAAAAVAVVVLARAGAALTPLWLLGLLLLPWLPAPIPAAFLIWSGPLTLLVWTAVAMLMLGSDGLRWERATSTRAFAATTSSVRRRPRLAAGLLSLAIFGFAAWQAAPSVPAGDEPHYLIITQSLLLDGDLRIENNHRRGDYQAFYAGRLEPHYHRFGRDGHMYSIHAPGISALVAPAFAAGGYPAVVVFLVLMAAAGGALTWHVAWLATREIGSAWFGWAAVALSATTIFQSFSVYPDMLGGLAVLTGVWALLRTERERERGATGVWPWLLHGAALAMLPWLHTRFALLAGSLGALILLRLGSTPNPAGKAVAFLAVPAASALGWIGYFVAIYGTPDPSAPYGPSQDFSAAFIPGGLGGLLFDSRFGLLANAPVLFFGFAGLVLMAGSRAWRTAGRAAANPRRLALELTFVTVSYLLTVTNFAMWWGGWSVPARLATAIVPLLAVPCAFIWSRLSSRATRLTAAGALALTAFISTVLIVPGRGRLAFNTRDGYALWLDWATGLADLGRGVPTWFRGREGEFFIDVAVWVVLVVAVWAGLRAVDRLPALRGRASFGTAAALGYACAAMIAASLVWQRHDVTGIAAAPAQLDFLRGLAAEGRPLTLQLTPPRRLDADGAARSIRIDPGERFASTGRSDRPDRPLLNLPRVPAGRYRVTPDVEDTGGWLMVGIGQDQFALHTAPIPSPPDPIVIDFPVDVPAIVVRGDEDAQRVVRSITIEPLAIVPGRARLTGAPARRAVRYPAMQVFFLDDSSFPEPEAFWIGGTRAATLVLQPDGQPGAAVLLLRNAPVENEVTIVAGRWREALQLAPGEERRVRVPLDARRGATLVTFTTSAGFRPSAIDPDRRDDRWLGVWVRPEGAGR